MLSRSRFALFAALSWLASRGDAQGTGNFTSPGPQVEAGNLALAVNVAYGDQQTFRWTVDVPGVRLALWQQQNVTNGPDDAEDILDYNNTEGSYVWNGIPPQDLFYGNSFFLQIYDASYAVGDANPIATSQYLNVTGGPPSSSSSSSSSSTTSTSPPTSTATGAGGATTATDMGGTIATGNASPSPTPQPDHTNSLAIGLGVGLGCALLLALLAALFFWRRHSKKRQAGDATAGRTQDPYAGRESYMSGQTYYESAAKYSGPSSGHQSYQLHGDSVPSQQRYEKYSNPVEPVRSELQ